MRLLLAFFAVVAACNFQLNSANATVINYANLVGSSVFFNGLSENPSVNPTPTTGLYGTPTVMGNMLIFSPLSFEASKSGGGSSSVNSILSASLVAAPGFAITGVLFEEFGDYAITVPFTGGSGQVTAGLNATVGVTNSIGNFVASSNAPPGITAAPYNLSVPVNFAPTGAVNLSATNTLTAQSTTIFDDAFIKKKGFKLTVTTVPDGGVIPEPTSALIFLGLGLAGLSSRRRR